MDILELLKRAVKTSASVIEFGAGIQEPARKALADDLQRICSNCEKAYSVVLERLVPVKNTMPDAEALSKELRAFAADSGTRDAFKPEHLCGEVDHLLVRLSSNLDPIKYSVDARRIGDLRSSLGMVGDVDAAIYASYDEFARQLDDLATQINEPGADQDERRRYAQRVVREFELELRSAVDSVREAKASILGAV